MKLTTKEFKELYEWNKALEELNKVNEQVCSGLEDIKKVDDAVENVSCLDGSNIKDICDKFEFYFKEGLKRAADWMSECEHMLAMIETIKSGADEIAECDGELAALVTTCNEASFFEK